MADYPEKALYGTAQTVIDTASNVTAGNFSATTTIFDNTTDAAVPYARWGVATLFVNDWGGVPTAGGTVDLYGVLQDVDSTSDDTDAPSGSTVGGAKYFGSWVIAGVDAAQRRTIVIDLLGVKKCSFYYKNSTTQTATNTGANSTVKITPFSYGVTV